MFDELPFRCDYVKKRKQAKCTRCKKRIEFEGSKNVLRIAKNLQAPNFDSRIPRWYHYDCFFDFPKLIITGPEQIASFEFLAYKDQERLKKSIKDYNARKPKRQKIEEELTSEQTEQLGVIEQQSQLLYSYYDQLKELKEKELFQIRELNNIRKIKPVDSFKRTAYLADAMAFGLAKCPKCDSGLLFKRCRYICKGMQDGWKKCMYTVEKPERQVEPLEIPTKLKLKYKFLQEFSNSPTPVNPRVYIKSLKDDFNSRKEQKFNELNKEIKLEPQIVEPVLEKNYPEVGQQSRKPKAAKFDSVEYSFLRDKDANVLYNALLIKVDILKNKNSFYKMQLLKSRYGEKYMVHFQWGRIGTTNGDVEVQFFPGENKIPKKIKGDYNDPKEAAIYIFESKFSTKTGNQWNGRQSFVKKPGLYQCIKVATGPYNAIRWPVGKPTIPQNINLNAILTKLFSYNSVTKENLHQLVNLWNQFYTFVPQWFDKGSSDLNLPKGKKSNSHRPPLIGQDVIEKQKLLLLEIV